MAKAPMSNRRRQVFNLCRCGECKVCILSARRDGDYRPRGVWKRNRDKPGPSYERKRAPFWMEGYDGPRTDIVAFYWRALEDQSKYFFWGELPWLYQHFLRQSPTA